MNAGARCVGPMESGFHHDGFCMARAMVQPGQVDALLTALGPVDRAGRRGLLAHPEVHRLATSAAFLDVVSPLMSGTPRPVRGILFDKSPTTNWLVPWHQDLTIVVQRRIGVSGFGPWSRKDGRVHVQPPAEILRHMVTLRLHLDDVDASNGALRVLPESHCLGRLGVDEIERLRTVTPEVVCEARRGDALLMCPLILHASSRSTSGRHRRVLHLEYAGVDLPGGLEWDPAG